METSSGLEKIAEHSKKPNSLKHKLKALAVAVPLALMSYAPAIGQDTPATRPAEKKSIITLASYTDLRGTFGGSISLGKINDATRQGFRAGAFVEPPKSQSIRYDLLPYEDFYWLFSSEKLSLGVTADFLLGKSDGLLIGLGGGLGVELTESRNNLHGGYIICDSSASSSSTHAGEYVYSGGDMAKLFSRVHASASYSLSKKLLLGIEVGADFGRRPVHELLDYIYNNWFMTHSPKRMDNLIVGINLTYVLK